MSEMCPRRLRCLTALLALLGVVTLCSASGCSPSGTDGEPAPHQAVSVGSAPAQVRLLATMDFGEHALFDVTVGLEAGTTAMQALHSVADVATSYGDCFVDSINGVGATQQQGDWFYFMNGIMANSGACDYVLHDGDVEWWDYHDWSFRQNVSATLGCFPAAFVNGYDGRTWPTVVAFEQPFETEAQGILLSLVESGVDEARLVLLAELSSSMRETSNIVLVATPDAELVREVYGNWDRLGFFTHLESGTLCTYGASGEETACYTEGVGVLEAVQSPWNPSGVGVCENVVVLVSGCDSDGVRAAARTLAESGDTLSMRCTVIVRGGVVLPVPASAG